MPGWSRVGREIALGPEMLRLSMREKLSIPPNGDEAADCIEKPPTLTVQVAFLVLPKEAKSVIITLALLLAGIELTSLFDAHCDFASGGPSKQWVKGSGSPEVSTTREQGEKSVFSNTISCIRLRGKL